MTTKRSYSAKAARKGKDIGKPGKNFSKIAAKAGKRYGSEAAGKRVAGAILAKQRAKAKGDQICGVGYWEGSATTNLQQAAKGNSH